MENKIAIDFKEKQASYLEISQIIKENTHSHIGIKNIYLNEKTLDELEEIFPNKLIYYIEWSKILIIQNAISTQFVLSNLDLFLQCFIEFDHTAHQMMDLMAQTFEIDLDDSAQIWDIKRNRSNRQRGKINENLDYYFHGGECAFTNHTTGQYIDIKIMYGREYGVIDNYFLYKFIETTKSLAKPFELLDQQSYNLRKVINVFKKEGYLINRPHHTFEELILNRELKNH